MDSEPVKRVNADQMHHVCLEANRHLDKYGAMAKEVNKLLGRIPAHPAPVVQCPYPCGWDNLNKLAIQDAALVARGLVEGEPTTEAQRQAAISNNDRLLKIISACRAAMLQEEPVTTANKLGNSPLIPDGYVMVPKEPTESMLNAWLSEVANWRGHVAGYKAMLAAAPQEVK
ncbi:hypothetical protein BLK91_08660 [Klebsiella pneumoniae]|nr:hypothetical protein BLK91_08660 [Klebsiella pneumoniae]